MTTGTGAQLGGDEVRRRSRLPRPQGRAALIVAFSLAALAAVGIPVLVSHWVGRPTGVDHYFEIPPGTAARVAAGEQVDVIPADFQLRQRDRLIVTNHDDQAHHIGPFTVDPGQRLDRRLSDAFRYTGYCSLHPSGRIALSVRPAG